MERRRWCRRTAWGGGIASAVGIALFALFSDAGGTCTANVIVLNDGVIGPHGCAATSIAYHGGIGLMVIGAALLVGACALAVIGRTGQGIAEAADTTATRAPTRPRAVRPDGPLVRPGEGPNSAESLRRPRKGEGTTTVRRPSPEREPEEQPEAVIGLPPGWYGNPSNRNGSVQWWDGHHLVDRPPSGGQ